MPDCTGCPLLVRAVIELARAHGTTEEYEWFNLLGKPRDN